MASPQPVNSLVAAEERKRIHPHPPAKSQLHLPIEIAHAGRHFNQMLDLAFHVSRGNETHTSLHDPTRIRSQGLQNLPPGISYWWNDAGARVETPRILTSSATQSRPSSLSADAAIDPIPTARHLLIDRASCPSGKTCADALTSLAIQSNSSCQSRRRPVIQLPPHTKITISAPPLNHQTLN
jgi:hypothetical protein